MYLVLGAALHWWCVSVILLLCNEHPPNLWLKMTIIIYYRSWFYESIGSAGRFFCSFWCQLWAVILWRFPWPGPSDVAHSLGWRWGLSWAFSWALSCLVHNLLHATHLGFLSHGGWLWTGQTPRRAKRSCRFPKAQAQGLQCHLYF